MPWVTYENPESQVLVVNTGTSSSLSQETLQIPTSDFRCKEKLALKLNSLNDRKARYESHKTFLSKCYRDKIIPHGLSIYVEPSFGNQDEAFLETWHENLQSFSLTLMSQIITFCDQTINKVNEEIEKTKVELHAKLDRNEREEIIFTLEKNDELNRKQLQQRKTKKFNYLKFKPKNQSPSEENEEIIHTEKTTNEHHKPPYAAVLKRRSNTNLRRKFSKQNLAEYEQNSSVKNSILNARRNHCSNRNTTTEVPAAKQTENNKNEVLQNEIKILKKEIESMKKDHSVVSQIPTRRQLFLYPPSKLSPQKTAVETTQKEPKNGNAASVDGGQKQHQIKQVIKFIQSAMQTLSEYEKQFQELFNTDLTQTEIQSISLNIRLQRDGMICYTRI